MASTILPSTVTGLELFRTTCGHVVARTDLGSGQGLFSLLTPCCQAAATGTTRGVACKGCYAEVAACYGHAATSAGELVGILAEAGCPIAVDCALNADYRLDEAAGRI